MFLAKSSSRIAHEGRLHSARPASVHRVRSAGGRDTRVKPLVLSLLSVRLGAVAVRVGVVVLWFVGTVWIGAVARADRSAAQLEYRLGPGTESCPSEHVFRELVASRLGHDPFDASGTRTFVIELSRSGRNVFLSIHERAEEGGERILRGTLARCEDLTSSAALAVAMSIDPLAASGIAAAPEPAPETCT